MTIAPEQPVIIACIIAEQTLKKKIRHSLPKSKDLEFRSC